MTCIVGIVDGGRVWIGGDSAGASGLDVRVRRDVKVFKIGEVAFGFTTSFRMGQLLAHTLSPPVAKVGQDLFAYLVADFVPAVRRCLEAGGWAQVREGQHWGGQFLVGVGGRLFCIHDDFQVAEAIDGFDAVGCGASFALGALAATRGQGVAGRIVQVLEIATEFSGGVRPPYTIEIAGAAA